MTDLITPAYRDQNIALFRASAGYGTGGARHGVTVATFARTLQACSVLDYGCGRGALKAWLTKHAGYLLVREYDPAIADKDHRPKAADLVVCTDVLEHVEPECLRSVLADLRRLAKRGAFLTIATRPSNKILDDGRNAHLLIRSAKWWLKTIRSRGWLIHDWRLVVRKHGKPRSVQLWLGRGSW